MTWDEKKLDALVAELEQLVKDGFAEAEEIEDEDEQDASIMANEVRGYWLLRLKRCRA